MPSPEIERKPSKPCASSKSWRNGNTSVQQRSRRSILDLAKKKNVWIGWKNLTSSRTALVGILRLTRSTTAFATSRASRRWSKKFLARTYEDRQFLRRAEAAEGVQGRRGLSDCGVARRAGGIDRLSRVRCAAMGAAHFYSDRPARFSDRGSDGVGV